MESASLSSRKKLAIKRPPEYDHPNDLNSDMRVQGPSSRRIMTPRDESPDFSEVTKSMPLLKTRATININTRNVRTLKNQENQSNSYGNDKTQLGAAQKQ
ncbi:unnamed protein product [Schistosoma mattheei]|uniref:Uncharacterized protein n=1 Tax=Schistosoma mattheei TaxID=31246 RepID=A0AA85BFT2_9TREM|nr:unnamed protein product [Schistosoma mattheei]